MESDMKLLKNLKVKDDGPEYVHLEWEPFSKKSYTTYQVYVVKANDPEFRFSLYSLGTKTDCKCSNLDPNTTYCFIVCSTDPLFKCSEKDVLVVKTKKTIAKRVAPVLVSAGVAGAASLAIAAATFLTGGVATLFIAEGIGIATTVTDTILTGVFVGSGAIGFTTGTIAGIKAGEAFDKILSPEDYADEFIRRMK